MPRTPLHLRLTSSGICRALQPPTTCHKRALFKLKKALCVYTRTYRGQTLSCLEPLFTKQRCLHSVRYPLFDMLQCVAVSCSVLQCVAVCCLHSVRYPLFDMLQCVAVCCSVLQRVAVCCLHSVGYPLFDMLQCVAVCCSVLSAFRTLPSV